MEAVTIHDLSANGVLAVHLIDILRLCEPEAVRSLWRVNNNIECLGALMAEFEQASDTKTAIGGTELLRLAGGVYQIIWGDFEARLEGEVAPWRVVRAIDSTFYVVITSDVALLERVKERYKDVRPSPKDAEYEPFSAL
jgi:hypothetical protein